jgi:hypothetical protein
VWWPCLGVAHHDGAALGVVVGDTHGFHVVCVLVARATMVSPPRGVRVCVYVRPPNLDAKLLVNLVLDGQAVAVPPKAALYMETLLVRIARHNVLQVWVRTRARVSGRGPTWRAPSCVP